MSEKIEVKLDAQQAAYAKRLAAGDTQGDVYDHMPDDMMAALVKGKPRTRSRKKPPKRDA